MSVMPALAASSTTYWMAGLSTTGSISLGMDLLAGSMRVPKPATGITAFLTFMFDTHSLFFIACGIIFLPAPVVGTQDRKSVVSGKSVSVRVDLGGRRILKKKNRKKMNTHKEKK